MVKKSTVQNGSNQKPITSFFTGIAMGVASSPKKSACSGKNLKSLNVHHMNFDLQEDEIDRENLPPSSPALVIPETPDSQIQSSHPASNLKVRPESPVARTSHQGNFDFQKALTARRPLLSPRERRPPLSLVQLGEHNVCTQSRDDSAKVLLHGPNLDVCLKTINSGTLQVKRKSSDRDQDAHQKRKLVLSQDEKAIGPEPQEMQANNMPPLRPIQIGKVRSSGTFCSKLCSFSSNVNAAPLFTDQKAEQGLKCHSGNGPESFVMRSIPDGKEDDTRDTEVDHLHVPLGTEISPENTPPLSNGDIEMSEGVLTCSEEDLLEDEDFWSDDKMVMNDPDTANANREKAILNDVILSTGLYNRYWVLDAQEVWNPRGVLQKHLKITASKTMSPTETCILKDGWESTPVSVGDIIHLEGECISGMWLIDGNSGFLVLSPDILISSTAIASSIRCMRRAVLSEKFKGFDGNSRQMLNGTMVHEIFQKAAVSGGFVTEKLQQLADQTLLGPSFLREMYSLKVTQEDMRSEVEGYLQPVADWAKDYLHSSVQARKKQLMLKLPSEPHPQDPSCNITVTDFIDIEENIWSPRFGLKGKIDLTAKVRIHRKGRSCLERVVPLELKTGRESNSIEHRSQVILYNLMSLERRRDAEAGFLVYLKTGSMYPIVSSHMDKRELLKLRNTLVHHLRNSLVDGEKETCLAPLPEIISDRQTCKYCPQMRNCAVYNRAIEGGGGGGAESQPPFVEAESQHLRETHLRYFSHWVHLCALEAKIMEGKGGRRGIWLQTVQEREAQGCCVGNLLRTGEVTAMPDNTYSHCFQRQGSELPVVGLSVGDGVLLSSQDSMLFAVAKGYVTEVSRCGIACRLDRSLLNFPADVLFCLDQDEGERSLNTHLTNVSKLMVNSSESERLRDLIVEFRPPRFFDSLSSVLPREAKDTVANILKGLNKPQKQAMKKVLLSKDYTLIVGMPGTGKTTTICSLVRILHACGFSVLLTSYTHSAVDNILLKLQRFKVGFLRLGHAHKIHPAVRPFTEEHYCASSITTLTELEKLYSRELVVATTCMGVRHPIFSRRRFDFCIVDEASQISQPVCLGPLFHAERFVLVGDHQQLAPIVKSPKARALGMDESLFKRLECHNDAVVQLNMQYRMNSKIMSLSNMLMYEGKLECGSERTASAVLELPMWGAVERELELNLSQPDYLTWIQAALEPQNPVCFLDTAKVPALETVTNGGVSNPIEAILVHGLVSLLLKAGCHATDIGVIAPYRQHLSTISGLLGDAAFSAVEVNTVDKYQGRDKSVVIVSFVRSHTQGRIGELLKDWRRLNVAVTRAKRKLLLLGCVPTLRCYAPLEKLLNHMEREGTIISLPPAAHEALSAIPVM